MPSVCLDVISNPFRSNIQWNVPISDQWHIWLLLAVPYILNLKPFRHRFVCPGRVLLRSCVSYIWVDAQRQPGALWAQLYRGVLLLLVLHAFKSIEQTRGRKAFDDKYVLIWGCQGPAEAHEQGEGTEWDIYKDSGWTVARGRIMVFLHFAGMDLYSFMDYDHFYSTLLMLLKLYDFHFWAFLFLR